MKQPSVEIQTSFSKHNHLPEISRMKFWLGRDATHYFLPSILLELFFFFFPFCFVHSLRVKATMNSSLLFLFQDWWHLNMYFHLKDDAVRSDKYVQ